MNDHGENSVLTILGQGNVHGAQVFSDASNNSIVSQATRTWPDSPLSCYNVTVSRSNSRCSSRPQSPGSGMQLESQLMPYNVSGSPLGSPQVLINTVLLTLTDLQYESLFSEQRSYLSHPTPLSVLIYYIYLFYIFSSFSFSISLPTDRSNVYADARSIVTFVLESVLRRYPQSTELSNAPESTG